MTFFTFAKYFIGCCLIGGAFIGFMAWVASKIDFSK